MSTEELTEVVRLIGTDEKDMPPEEEMISHILQWMANMVGRRKAGPDEVERAVLEWVATGWGVQYEPTLDTDNLERGVRLKIATEAAEFLGPTWRLAVALTVEENTAVSFQKLEMLKQAARLAVPSDSALRNYHQEWSNLADDWDTRDPREDLAADLEVLKAHPEVARNALKLGLVIALADGRLAAEEERLARDLGPPAGIPDDEARGICSELNQLFWRHQNEMAAGSGGDSLEAARRTLEESGALEGLATEACYPLLPDEDDAPKKSGFSRLLGALGGLGLFFKSRMSDGAQAALVRIVYLTICKQHMEVIADSVRPAQAEPEAAEPGATRRPPPPPAGHRAPPAAPAPLANQQPMLKQLAVDMPPQEERKSIKLE